MEDEVMTAGNFGNDGLDETLMYRSIYTTGLKMAVQPSGGVDTSQLYVHVTSRLMTLPWTRPARPPSDSHPSIAGGKLLL